MFFGYRELTRMCIRPLREAKGPMRFDVIVERMTEAKGIEVDRHLQKHIADTTSAGLLRMARKGAVRRILEDIDVWWELGEWVD